MSVTTLTAQAISRTGLDYALSAANADGSKWANTGKEFLMVTNAGGSNDCVVTINSLELCDQEAHDHDIVVTVPKSTHNRMIGPFPVGRFNDANGFCGVSFDEVTSVTIAVITLPFA